MNDANLIPNLLSIMVTKLGPDIVIARRRVDANAFRAPTSPGASVRGG